MPQSKRLDEGRSARSLDFIDRTVGIAGNDPLGHAVHEQIEVFEHNRADQSGLPPGLDDGSKGSVAT